MFRRKTDLVYSTLQQVQRRMTNQTESGQSQSASRSNSRGAQNQSGKSPKIGTSAYKKQPARKATLSPFNSPKVRSGQGEQQQQESSPTALSPNQQNETITSYPSTSYPSGIQGMNTATLNNNMGGPVPQAEPARYAQGILLTFPMLCVMLLLWVLSIAVAYNLGPSSGVVVEDPGIGSADGIAGLGPTERDTTRHQTVVPTKNRDILVLKSVTTTSNQAIEEFRQEANKLNEVARKYPDVLKPYFGFRKTSRGGLQLIFGVIDGVTGVNQSEYSQLKGIMSKSGPNSPNNGKGYPDAFWSDI